ncbi:MAG: 50S ribosomal protein L13 [Candidatus Eisenbacteria bacterium]|nr:50S ribosomal protein L13 [Candidatus Eisenbacteria bacterium]
MSTHATKASEITRKWYLVDAGDQPLGRLSSEVAGILRGKWKRNYVPYLDVGDHVIVINAAKIRFSGRKLETERRFTHSGYPGGEKWIPLARDMQRRPEEVIRRTVRGMLPHTRLGRAMIRKLKVYAGPEHPHAAQNPVPLKPGHHGRFLEAQGEQAEES